MKKNIVRKEWVVGIIVLFIGIGFKPVLSNEVTTPSISDSEEDCDCNIPYAKLHLAEKVINKAENYLVSKDLINSKSLPFERPICEFLKKLGEHYAILFLKYDELRLNAEYGTPLYWYYTQLVITFGLIILYLNTVGTLLFCWPSPY